MAEGGGALNADKIAGQFDFRLNAFLTRACEESRQPSSPKSWTIDRPTDLPPTDRTTDRTTDRPTDPLDVKILPVTAHQDSERRGIDGFDGRADE